MNKQQAEKHITENLEAGDQLIGFFFAIKPANFWLIFLLGPFFMLTMRQYYVAVTEQGVSFFKLDILGKFQLHDFFSYSDIESVKIGRGLLQRPMIFTFKTNRKLKLKAQLKGVEKVATLKPEVQTYIEQNIPLSL